MFRKYMICLVGFFLWSSAGFSAGKTLLNIEGGKPKTGLAKAWKKVSEGQYEFTLDTDAELKPGVKLSPSLVKDSLESKLGSILGVKVIQKGKDKVVVSFKGDEQKFLDQVSKAKIRGGKDVELALESSVSEGSIRAKQADRSPSQGEIKCLVYNIEENLMLAVVNVSNDSRITSGSKIKVRGSLNGMKKNDTFFFIPGSLEGDVWIPKAGSLQ